MKSSKTYERAGNLSKLIAGAGFIVAAVYSYAAGRMDVRREVAKKIENRKAEKAAQEEADEYIEVEADI